MIRPHPSNRLRSPVRQSVEANNPEAHAVDRSIPHDTCDGGLSPSRSNSRETKIPRHVDSNVRFEEIVGDPPGRKVLTGVTELATVNAGRNAENPCVSLSGVESAERLPIVSRQASRECIADPTGIVASGPPASAGPLQQRTNPVGRGRSPRYERRDAKRRYQQAVSAVEFAYRMDWPLNCHLTITWHALVVAADVKEGHCLWRPPGRREAYVRTELARRLRALGLPFAAIWARDVGKRLGSHMHILIYWPTYLFEQFLRLIERLTGSRRAQATAARSRRCLARSECGGWMITAVDQHCVKAGALNVATYISSQREKHPVFSNTAKAFGVSQALGPTARRRHNLH
jgi:hypothetical protein